MRKNLGNIIIFILFFFYLDLGASTYTWSAFSSKKEAYINESIYLKYTCAFSDRGELYTIEFNPVIDNETYNVTLLSENMKIVDGKRINTFEYIASVKKAMVIQFDFDIKMKKTTKDSIEETVLGRDNIENEDFFITVLKQNEISVDIKETNTSLTGDFTVDVEKDSLEIKAYEPYHFSVKISGNGNFKQINPILFEIDGVKVFSQNPILKTELTKKGETGFWSQKFALVSDENFVIPDLSVKYFDLNTQKLHNLEIESTKVNVLQVYKKEELLDDIEEDKPIDFSFLYYILTFVAGFLVGKINFKREKTDSKNKLFIEKISAAKSLNELSMILILENERKFSSVLTEIDTKESISLSQAKSKALKLIQD